MTTYERFKRMFEHKEADRIPIIDNPWKGTIRHWHDEGMPKDVEWQDYFGVDKEGAIGIDLTARMPKKIIEETVKHKIVHIVFFENSLIVHVLSN